MSDHAVVYFFEYIAAAGRQASRGNPALRAGGEASTWAADAMASRCAPAAGPPLYFILLLDRRKCLNVLRKSVHHLLFSSRRSRETRGRVGYASIDSSHRAIRTINVRGLPSRPHPVVQSWDACGGRPWQRDGRT